MAIFTIAYNRTETLEGGYSNNPNDKGGETWKGIARNANPNWDGWKVVDTLKRQTGFPTILKTSTQLQEQVLDIYKRQYWNVLKLDEVKNQDIANKLYDISVNMGFVVAGKMLQQTLNVTNQNGKYYPDLIVDGRIGSMTIKAINLHPRPEVIFKCLNVLQGQKYIEIAEHNKSQEDFINGWFMNRIAAAIDPGQSENLV